MKKLSYLLINLIGYIIIYTIVTLTLPLGAIEKVAAWAMISITLTVQLNSIAFGDIYAYMLGIVAGCFTVFLFLGGDRISQLGIFFIGSIVFQFFSYAAFVILEWLFGLTTPIGDTPLLACFYLTGWYAAYLTAFAPAIDKVNGLLTILIVILGPLILGFATFILTYRFISVPLKRMFPLPRKYRVLRGALITVAESLGAALITLVLLYLLFPRSDLMSLGTTAVSAAVLTHLWQPIIFTTLANHLPRLVFVVMPAHIHHR